MRRFLATASMGASGGVGEHPLTLIDHAIHLLRVVLVLSIWRAVIRSDEAPAGLSQASVLTYVLLGAVLAQQLDARTEVSNDVWQGTVVTRLLRPVSTFGDYIAEMIGRWSLQTLVFSLPLLALSPLLGVGLAPASPARAAAFAASLALSVAVGLAIDFLFGVVIINFSQSMWALRYARDGITPLLTGAMIPLSLLPWHLGDVLAWSPFASMASAPLRIYIGDGDPARLIGLQIGWTVVLWCGTRWAWQRAAARMVTAGG